MPPGITATHTTRAATLTVAFAAGLLRAGSAAADVLDATAGGHDWAGYGRTDDQTHYSPLGDISVSNVGRLGLAWYFDIPGVVLATSVPLEVNGTLYFASGYSVVRALEATTGHLLWTYDPEVSKVAGHKLRAAWGIRGIAYWNNKVYVGTHDGRLISIDAMTGKPVWTASTIAAGDLRFISGPPVVFNGTVMIGNGGSDLGAVRGYVTAYDANTGRQRWRFYTVPGNPVNGFENKAMEMAAKTWTGQWWKYGGGGTVWNAMTYDRELNRVYIGTSNGSPWNRKIRSPGGGDNLFVSAIVALDADTGAYVWHYQTNPGETWDFDANMDIELARLVIDGKPRRILMQASKNGFFYVIDRDSGTLISAEKFAQVTWAERIDLDTGRPIETPNARYANGETRVWPGSGGAHGPQPMAFNPSNGLAYIPTLDLPGDYNDKGIDLKAWTPNSDFTPSVGIHLNYGDMPVSAGTSALVAWDPATQRAVWRSALPGIWNGGTLATAGNLVFQGRCDGRFVAYAADTGATSWSFDAHVGIVGAPIAYKVSGRQYLAVLAGFGGPGAMLGSMAAQFGWDARSQPRRLLVFSLDGRSELPPASPRVEFKAVNDPQFHSNPEAELSGSIAYANRCSFCHGGGAIAGGNAPDLRASPIIISASAFRSVVQGGTLLERGMPRFDEVSPREIEAIRQYLRERAHKNMRPFHQRQDSRAAL